jgi:hypothetical protein
MATVALEAILRRIMNERYKISLIESFDPEFGANFASLTKKLPPLDRFPSETR